MRRINLAVSAILAGLICPIISLAITSDSYAITADQKHVIQEVSKALYRKGTNIQYENVRMDPFSAPEQTTSQSANFLVCTGFIKAVYYESFRMTLPISVSLYNSYAVDYCDPDSNNRCSSSSNPDILYRLEENEIAEKTGTANSREAFKNELLEFLDVGDILGYHGEVEDGDDFGHVVLIYDFVYDSNHNKVDATVLHSTSSYTRNYSKNKLSWHDAVNSTTGVAEGTIQQTTLSSILSRNTIKKSTNLAVFRPLAQGNGTYNKISCVDDATGPIGKKCSYDNIAYTTNPVNQARIRYPGIDIEKTVDVFNNSVVEPGDELKYTIKVANNSNASYRNIKISNDVQADLVKVVDGNPVGEITEIPASTVKTYTYTVKVNNDASLLGRELTSTGEVGGIPSAKITNYIGTNLATEDQSKIKGSYNKLKTKYSGAKLIDKIYEDALGEKTDFSNLILGSHVASAATGKKCNPYHNQGGNVNSLIKTVAGLGPTTISLNKENAYLDMLLPNYYSALNIAYNNSCEEMTIYIKRNLLSAADTYGEALDNHKMRRVYPENLQTGDVLVYMNAGGGGKADPVTNEKGTYAFIWFDGGFHGVNKMDDSTILNEITDGNTAGANNLWSLYGKDYFAIFRPALRIESKAEPQSQPEGTKPKTEKENAANPVTLDSLAIMPQVLVGALGVIGIAAARLSRRRF